MENTITKRYVTVNIKHSEKSPSKKPEQAISQAFVALPVYRSERNCELDPNPLEFSRLNFIYFFFGHH